MALLASAALLVGLLGRPSPTQCPGPGGKLAPCGPGNERCAARPLGPWQSPQFHQRDRGGCAQNDPNFPFFDAAHGIYHLFYQDHLAEPGGIGPVIGHVVSRDLVRWAQLDAALWNDQPFDRIALFTGSATIVDGLPYMIYPGLCNRTEPLEFAGCTTGYVYAQAVPANASDPLMRRWAKADAAGVAQPIAPNPIVNGTGDDPSSAWRTPFGEWRFVGVENGASPVYSARNFTGPWRKVGISNLPAGECQSLFELPKLYPGSASASFGSEPSAVLPTHVHKRGRGARGCSGDCMQLGKWVDGSAGEVGNWSGVVGGVQNEEVVIDLGNYYASKDFLAPDGRRINWGWAAFKGGGMALPREVRYHAALNQLVHSPLAETALLHGSAPPLADLGPTSLPADGTALSLGEWAPAGVGNASDINLTFALPTQPACFNVSILNGSLTLFTNFTPGSGVARVGVAVRGGKHVNTTLRLLPSDKDGISLRLFVDRIMVEAFWMDGRVALTYATPSSHGLSWEVGVSATAGAGGRLISATAFAMENIWVSPDQVLATPRRD